MEFEVYPQQQFPLSNYGGAQTMDMRSLAGALPDYSMRQYQQQPFQHQFPSHGGSNQNLMYQYQQGAQFAGQTASNYNPNLGQQYHSQYMQPQAARPQQPGFVGYPTSQTSSRAFQNQPYPIQQDFNPGQPQQFLQIPSSGQYGPQFGGRGGSGYQQPQLRQSSGMAASAAMPMYQQLAPQRKSSS